MDVSRCLGLVGGLGVGATIHYYKELAKVHEARGRTLNLVIAHAETSRVFEYVRAGDRKSLAQYLVSFIHRLVFIAAYLVLRTFLSEHREEIIRPGRAF
jgi:aspartate racemase